MRAYDEQKFAELVLYVAERMAEERLFGATVLNKVLYFSDFIHYAQYGEPITSADYMHLPHGPAPRRMIPVQQELVAQGDAAVQERQVGAYMQKRLVPLRDPNLSLFGGTEIGVVENVIASIRGRSASAVSELSHGMIGWKVTPEHETIPYESIFLYHGPVTAEDEKKAGEIAHDLAGQLAAAGVATA